MTCNTYATSIILALLLVGCSATSPVFTVKTSAKNNTAVLGETITLSLYNPDGISVKTVAYYLDGNPVSETLNLSDAKLGKQHLIAKVITTTDTIIAKSDLVVLNNKNTALYALPESKYYNQAQYTVEIVNTYPHDTNAYTQGLEFYNGVLYESIGQYGESELRKVDYKTGEIIKRISLKNGYFGEGLTILNDKIYQLTWKADTGFVYDVNTFEKLGIFRYDQSKEGWGLCNDGTNLYKSDGTEKLWTLNTATLTEDNKIEAYTNKKKIGRLNELEWVNGKIYANVYEQNFIAVINPKNGSTDALIYLEELTKKIPNYSKNDNVLNGIAYNPDTNTIFVTGKRWNKLFELKITKKQ